MATFSGVIVPVLTPFGSTPDQPLAPQAANGLIDHLVDAGVSGLFTFGSNGEFHVASDDERIAYTAHVVKRVAGQVPVIAGVGACSTRAACELARRAQDVGATGLSVVNPYFLQPTDDELAAYFEAVANVAEVPVLLYNIPKATGRTISPEVVAKLAGHPRIAGIKDSSGNLELLQAYLDAGKDYGLDVLVGSDGLISQAHAMGASGAVAGTANLVAPVVVGLWRALEAGNEAAAQELQAAIEPVRNVLHLGPVPQMLKRLVELAGYPVGPARLPVGAPTAQAEEAARALVAELELSSAAEALVGKLAAAAALDL